MRWLVIVCVAWGSGGCLDAGEVAVTKAPFAYFYQTVEPQRNAVRAGTSDGAAVDVFDADAVSWLGGPGVAVTYGDPVFSRRADGRWVMTAWTTERDPRGAGVLLVHEAACPIVDDARVVAIGPSSAGGCLGATYLLGGKTSQVFEHDLGAFVFFMHDGDLWLAKLAEPGGDIAALSEICLREYSTSIEGLAPGYAVEVLSSEAAGDLLLSDSAIARRADGIWVLFVKGIPADHGCAPGSAGSLCELCKRGIYRWTSPRIDSWYGRERVVGEASVPEAAVDAVGNVWLAWQDFSATCAASDLTLAARAPISTAIDGGDGFLLGEKRAVTFEGEAFTDNVRAHFATNGNPVTLPDAVAVESFRACFD